MNIHDIHNLVKRANAKKQVAIPGFEAAMAARNAEATAAADAEMIAKTRESRNQFNEPIRDDLRDHLKATYSGPGIPVINFEHADPKKVGKPSGRLVHHSLPMQGAVRLVDRYSDEQLRRGGKDLTLADTLAMAREQAESYINNATWDPRSDSKNPGAKKYGFDDAGKKSIFNMYEDAAKWLHNKNSYGVSPSQKIVDADPYRGNNLV